MSQLAGISLSHGIRNITNPAQQSQTVLGAMGEGLLKGATSVGLQFATQGLDPTLGGLASSAIAGAIDGLVSPADPNQPLGQRKGIFAGIGETLTRAVGGFTEIGIIKAGDPVGNAMRLAQLNDFSTIIREQGLGAAVETYAAGLLHRSSVESLYNAGISLDRNNAIRAAINAQLQDPDNRVELEGREAIQINLGGGNHLWVDPTSHALIATLQGQDYVRYGTVLVDPNTRTIGTPNATIERTFTGPDGATVTARFLEEISAGGVTQVSIEAGGTRYTVTPNGLQHVRLNADGTVRDGILTEVQTGNKLYFQNGNLVASQARPFADVNLPSDFPVMEIPQATLELTQTPMGEFDVRMETPTVATTPPENQEPLKTVTGDLRNDLSRQVGTEEAQRLWDKIQALVPQNQAMPNIAVVLRPAEVRNTGGAFGSTTLSYDVGSFYQGDVPREALGSIRVDLTTGTVSIVGGGKKTFDGGRGEAGAYWKMNSTGGILPTAVGVGAVTSTRLSDSHVVQNTYGLKATGAELSQVVYEQQFTTISGNSIQTVTITKEPNPWVKATVQTAELFLAGWGLKKVGVWAWGKVADDVGQAVPSFLSRFREAFAAGT